MTGRAILKLSPRAAIVKAKKCALMILIYCVQVNLRCELFGVNVFQ